MSKRYTLGCFFILGGAEIGSSMWLVLRAPADGPTNVYSGFPDYEFGRLLCWAPAVGISALFWFLLNRRLASAGVRKNTGQDQPSRPHPCLISTLAVGFAIETFASVCYWMTPYSKGVRALYESAWYWHRVPHQSDYGWPSFRGYFLDHLIPWAGIFVAGLIVWFIWSRRQRARPGGPSLGS